MVSFLLLFALFVQDDVETEVLIIDQIRPDFENALRTFKSVERQNSLPLFEKIMEELLQRPERNEDENLMLSESMKHLAVLTFPEKTEFYFEQMIRLNPGSEIPAGTLSPKFIRQFNELKSKLTGSLLVQVVEAADPSNQFLSGGRLLVDGVFTANAQADIPIPVLAGVHQITLEFPNFDPLVQEIDVPANGQKVLGGILYRNAADLGFITSPQDVKILFNGVEWGTTSGTAPLDFADHLMAEGLTPSQASDLLKIDQVPLGNHEVLFEKPCFQSRKISVPVEELKSFRFKPVVLQPSKATLSVTTVTPTAGIVFLDRERVGSLPLLDQEVCPGSYTLRVQFPDGQFIKKINLVQDESYQYTVKPQPSLAWFGIQEKEGERPTQPIDSWFHGLKTWNVLDVDSTDSALISHDPFALLFNDDLSIGDQSRILTQTLKADLFVAARVIRKKTIIRFLEVAFWSPLSPKIKRYSFDFRKMGDFQNLLQSIDSPLDLLTPWLGLEVLHLNGTDGLKILSIHPESPLSGQVNQGEYVIGINGNPIKQPSDLLTDSFNPLTLTVGNRNIQVNPFPAIVELPFIPKIKCPQAVIAQLEKIGNYAENAQLRSSAKFNLARYYFFMQDFQQAFDLFSGIQLSSPYGIGKGTLHFYQGLCFQKLNLKNEAANSFRNATQFPNSTLFGPDGPKAKLWAETQLSILTSP